MHRRHQGSRIARAMVVLIVIITSGIGYSVSPTVGARVNGGVSTPGALTAHPRATRQGTPSSKHRPRAHVTVTLGTPSVEHAVASSAGRIHFTPGLKASALPAVPPASAAQPFSSAYLSYVSPAHAQPLRQAVPQRLPTRYDLVSETRAPIGPYRTTVSIQGLYDLIRLKELHVTTLGVTMTSATVIADRLQLERLALGHFFPHHTDLVAHLHIKSGGHPTQFSTAADLLAAGSRIAMDSRMSRRAGGVPIQTTQIVTATARVTVQRYRLCSISYSTRPSPDQHRVAPLPAGLPTTLSATIPILILYRIVRNVTCWG